MNVIVILALIVCFLSSLYPASASFRRLKEKFSEATMYLFGFMSAYSLVILYGVVLRLGNGGGVDLLSMQQITAAVGQSGYSMEAFNLLTAVIAFCLAIANIVFGLIIHKTKHPIVYCLALSIIALGVLSVPAVFVTGCNPVVNFFMECCGVMAYFAWMLDLTYKEFCVIGNIYIEAALCLMAAVAPLLLCLRTRKGFVMTAFCAINAAIHSVVFLVICMHYWMPLEDGFDLCYKELNQMGTFTGLGYIAVNIVLFVILFVGDLIVNAVIYQLVKRFK